MSAKAFTTSLHSETVTVILLSKLTFFVFCLLSIALRYAGELTATAIASFVTDFESGSVLPILKSEPIPEAEAEAGTVVDVVGLTFDKLVLETNKWVLLQIYAPWCGHCKLLEPVWSELVRELSKM